jgi:DNA-binding transcriptional ArsR family regulator
MKLYTTQTQYFKILMHPTRWRSWICCGMRSSASATWRLVFGLRQAHISQHLMVLREAGLVSDRRDGWNIFYRVVKPEIYQVIDAMNAFSGKPSGNPFAAKLKASKRECPCPKCNVETPSPGPELVVLSPDSINAVD